MMTVPHDTLRAIDGGYEFTLGDAEPFLTLSDAAAEIGRMLGDAPHTSTVRKQIARGVDGIRLPAIRRGGQWRTKRSAILWFLRATTTAAANRTIAPRDRSGAPLSEAERATLQRAGIVPAAV